MRTRTRTQIDSALRPLGYFLRRVPRGAAPGRRWQVLSLASHTGWDCHTLAEVRSLLRALREREAHGGSVVWDGDGWACVEVEVD